MNNEKVNNFSSDEESNLNGLKNNIINEEDNHAHIIYNNIYNFNFIY